MMLDQETLDAITAGPGPEIHGRTEERMPKMLVMDIETTRMVSLELALEMCQSSGSFTGNGTAEEDANKYAATLPPLATIACVGFADGIKKTALVNCELFGGAFIEHDIEQLKDEAAVVTRAFEIIEDSRRWPLVTFSGRMFDLPMLITAALRHQIEIPDAVRQLYQENRFRPLNHIDVREQLTNFGATKGGLRAWCLGLGLGDPKADGDGSDVARLIAEGKAHQLAEYCLSDCEYTGKLYARWCLCNGLATVPF